MQLKRYYVASDWTPKKLEVLVDVPMEIDLAALRGRGPQPGEALQPEEEAPPAGAAAAAAPAAAAPPPAAGPDPELVAQLVAMGFSENGSKRAVLATAAGNAGGAGGGGGVEGAMEWVLAHMEDPGFNDPVPPAAPPPGEAAAAGAEGGGRRTPLEEADPESVTMLQGMGFEERQAAAALKACGGSLERAADWLFSRAGGEGLAAAVAEVEAHAAAAAAAGAAGASAPSPPPPPSSLPPLDAPGQSTYRLVAVVSHMGRSTACGHYVAHALRGNGTWALFNDDKVAASARVPTDLGFLYLFARADVAGGAGFAAAASGSVEKEKEDEMKE